jgi:hypothetical protein
MSTPADSAPGMRRDFVDAVSQQLKYPVLVKFAQFVLKGIVTERNEHACEVVDGQDTIG